MKIIKSPVQMQRQAACLRQNGKKIALVPTMGALHEGHLSLIRKARKMADIVVLSLYINPTQFGPNEDFSQYPRSLEKDLQLAEFEKADFVFAPESLYASDASTFIEETDCSQGRCGEKRPGHFRGVTTVVGKLLNIVQPHIAIFGQKDAQQCEVIERMVRDLHIPVKIVRAPITRDKHGLALSSRNQYLSFEEYNMALYFPRALQEAAKQKGLSAKEIEQSALALLKQQDGIQPEYVVWKKGFLCAAVRVGKTRLLDNVSYRAKK
jgi:pantoate--beta-alanine ligase